MLASIDGGKTNMIQLKFEDLNNNDFFSAFNKMMRLTNLDQQAKYEMKKIGEKVLKEYDRLRNKSMGLIHMYAELDEKGQPKRGKNERGNEEFILKDRKAYDEAFFKLMEETITVSRPKLKYKYIGSHPEITANDINYLEKIIDFPSES